MSIFKKEIEKDNDVYYTEFKSFSNILILKNQLYSDIEDYDNYYCNNNDYYYNITEDITITNYGVKLGFPFNTFYISYHIGKFTNSECGAVDTSKELSYYVYDAINIDGIDYCYMDNEFKYLNADGNKYTVHYNCFGNLSFKNGLGKMTYIDDMLEYGWLSMKDIVEFLDYSEKNKKATKTNFDNNGSYLYRNEQFSLLKCDNDKNKDIYISSSTFDYDINYCN